ncbi:MAG: hypothetical protein IPL67_09470 [Ignavibacteria bacterium]|nr:hypothetical protein [Ignavibacteria bacterium]
MKIENGKWKIENGKWKMENGKWKVENGNGKGSPQRVDAFYSMQSSLPCG